MSGNVIQLTLRVDDKGRPVVEQFVSSTKKGMDDVSKSSTGASTALGNLRSASSAVLGVLTAVGGAALAAATSGLAFAKGAASAGDEAYILGQKLGISAEKASELDYWAKSNGSSTEALSSAMRTLAQSASQAASGSKQDIAAFKAIGLTVDDVNPSLHSMDEIFRTVVGAMEKYSESGNKTTVQTQIMGRSITELRPALAGGVQGMDAAAQAGRVMGVIFSDQAASAAHELNNSFDDLRSAIRGVTNTIGADLFPVVRQVVVRTTDWIKENRELIATKVKDFIHGVVEAGKILGPIILKAADASLVLLDRLVKVNPQLRNFALTTAGVTVGAAGISEGLQKAAGGINTITTTVTNASKAIAALDANVTIVRTGLGGLTTYIPEFSSAWVAGFGIVAGAGLLVVNWIRDLSHEIGELADQSAAYMRSIQALNPELRTLTMTQSAFQTALARNNEELARAQNYLKSTTKTFGEEAAVTVKAKEKVAALEAEHARLGSAVDRAGKNLDAYNATQRTVTKTTTDADPPLKGHVGTLGDASDASEKLAEANRHLQENIDSLHVDALTDDLKNATEALKESHSVVADQNYLRALGDINAILDEQIRKANEAATAAVAAGQDSGLAWQVAAGEIDKATRTANDQLEGLNDTLKGNVEWWKKLADEILQLDPAIIALYPGLQNVLGATGRLGDVALPKMATQTEEVTAATALATGQISDMSKALAGLATGTVSATDALTTFLASGIDKLGTGLDAAVQSMGPQVKDALGNVIKDAEGNTTPIFKSFGELMGKELGSGFLGSVASAGTLAVFQVGATIFAKGVTDIIKGETKKGLYEAGATLAPFTFGTSLLPGLIASIIGIGPSVQEQIAKTMSKAIKAGLQQADVRTAVNDGLSQIGLVLTPGLERIMIEAPKNLGPQVRAAWEALGASSAHQFSAGFYQDMKEKGPQLIHSSVSDVLYAVFPEITDTVATGIQQSGLAAGAEIAHSLGLVGNKAVAYATQWSISFIAAAQQTGKSADEINRALATIAGPGAAIYAALDVLNADITELGAVSGEFFAQLNKDLTQLTGKKVHVGNLDDAMTVLTSLSFDSATALEFLTGELGKAGIKIEQFGSDWTNALLAISGDAGGVIKQAGIDMATFGSRSDGTAAILEQKVVTALEDVVKTADKLGYSAESVQAIGTAASLISPELLKSSSVVQALHDDFAQMAVGAHMSIRELVDSINPPIPAAVREAILSIDDLGMAIGALSGAPLRSLKEVTDRMKQFSGEMYEFVKDESGKTIKQLTDFGEQVVGDAKTAIDGMWTTINEDSWVGLDEVGKVFAELGNLPTEALSDPAIQSAMKSLLAKIGEALGDASIIAMANAETITQGMIDEATKKYDDYVDHIDKNPPNPQPPPTPDGQPAPAPEGSTTVPPGQPPPEPVPRETTQSYQDLSGAATEAATQTAAIKTALADVATQAGLTSTQVLAAVQPIIGTVDDGTSLAATKDSLRLVKEYLENEETTAFNDWSTASSIAISTVFTKVGELQSALNTMAGGNYDVHNTITTTYVTVGKPADPGGPPPDPNAPPPPPVHSGGKIPGSPGTEGLYLLTAGERVLSVEQNRVYEDLRSATRPAALADAISFSSGARYESAPDAGSSRRLLVDGGRASPSAREIGREVARALSANGTLKIVAMEQGSYDALSRSILMTDLPTRLKKGDLRLKGATLETNGAAPR